jgi:hypothetical protein
VRAREGARNFSAPEPITKGGRLGVAVGPTVPMLRSDLQRHRRRPAALRARYGANRGNIATASCIASDVSPRS